MTPKIPHAIFTICWINTNSVLWTASLSQTNPLSGSSKTSMTPLLPVPIESHTVKTNSLQSVCHVIFRSMHRLYSSSKAHLQTCDLYFSNCFYIVSYYKIKNMKVYIPFQRHLKLTLTVFSVFFRPCLRTMAAPFLTPQRVLQQ